MPFSTSLCVCISVNTETTRRSEHRKRGGNKDEELANRENGRGGGRGEGGGAKRTLTKHTHIVISHIKKENKKKKITRHGGARGKRPGYDIHPSCIVRHCAHIYISVTASRNVKVCRKRERRQTSSRNNKRNALHGRGEGERVRSEGDRALRDVSITSAIKRVRPAGSHSSQRCVLKFKELGMARERHAERKLY